MLQNQIHQAAAQHIKRELLYKQKWLQLSKVTYKDEKGVQREWESCDRTTRHNGIDSVEMIVHVKSSKNPSQETKILVVSQYRPPVESYTAEFPAGLIDEKETPEQAALRELKEETCVNYILFL